MRLKLDENLSQRFKTTLQDEGHDVSTAAEEGLLGKPDVEVGDAARRESRMLFTLDVGFADLRRFPPGSHRGVVLFRPRTLGPLAVNALVLEFTRETNLEELEGCVVVVESERVRLRRPASEAEPSGWEDRPLA